MSYVSTLTQYVYNMDERGYYSLAWSHSTPAGWNSNWTHMVPMSTLQWTQYQMNGWWSPLHNTVAV